MRNRRRAIDAHPLPWSVYPVRYSEKAPINHVQIRDALGNILFVSAKYGEHAGAPLDGQHKLELAEHVCARVNTGDLMVKAGR